VDQSELEIGIITLAHGTVLSLPFKSWTLVTRRLVSLDVPAEEGRGDVCQVRHHCLRLLERRACHLRGSQDIGCFWKKHSPVHKL
jgi:hypothetical protein